MRPLDALYYALQSKHGIVLRTNNIARARAYLYRLRVELADESLSILSFREGPNGELWIVRNSAAEPHPENDQQIDSEAISGVGADA